MEKAGKLRSAQSFPFLCHSPRSSSEHRAVPLGKSVSVSELVARYQSILDYESSMSKQEHPKLMERRYLAQSNVNPMEKKHTLSQSHSSDVFWSKSMEDLPIHKTSATTRNLKGHLTNLDTPKATPQSRTFPLAPLKTPSLNGISRKREADTRIMTTIQPLSRNTKLHKQPSFSSSLQSIQGKAQWSPTIITWKESPAKEGRISHDRQTIISSVTDTANDSAMGRSDERTRSFLDISDSTRRLLQQGRGRSSSLSVKELSARYLSQAAAAAAASQGSTTSPRTVKDSSTQSLNSQKTSKPMSKEVCASCLQPVYSMERVFPDKVCLHHTCFCCKICGKKLSLHNYAALHGVFYCQVHYKRMAGAKSRTGRERLEQQPGDDQMQRAAMVGRGTQPLDWYSGAENKTKARRKPTSFSEPCSLQLAEQRQELNSRPVFLGNKLRNCWPPSEADGKAGKGTCSWKKPSLSWQSHQAAGNKVDRMVLMGQERKTATEAAAKEGGFLPGVTYPEKREQVCSWPKPREQRDGEKAPAPGDGDVGNGKRGGQVSQRVTAFQQGKLQLKRGLTSASSPVLLEPAKPLPRGLLSFRQAASQCTKPTNWMFLGDHRGCVLPTTELPVKENEVCGSFSPSVPSEGDTRPAMTDDKPEWTAAIAGDKHNLGEGVNNPQPARVPESLETRNNTNMKQKYRDEGTDPPEPKAKHQDSHIPVVPGAPSAAPSFPEPGGLSASPEIAELVSETSKINADELPRKQMTVILEENMQRSSVSHLPGEESTGAEFEKTNKTKEVNPSGFLEEPSPDCTSQENKPEKNSISTLGLPQMTDDHNMSHLQETEPQATYGQLVTKTHSDILVHDVKSPSNDFSVSADMSLKRTSATRPSHNEVNNSKSKDPSEDLRGNIFPISKQPIEKLESSKSSISSDKYGGHPVGKEKMNLKHSEGSVVDTLIPIDEGKETRSSQARTDVLGKGFTFGKKPFTPLFGSEDKGSTHKKETTQRKPTKPQSALVTLFGHSSEKKKQSQQKNSAGSSERTNNEDKQEKLQSLLRSSSQAKQKASKNDQPPQPEKTVVIPEDTQESAGGCSDTTEGKETDVLLSAPGTSFSGDDKLQITELNVHDQPAVGRQVQQPQDKCCPSLLPAQENQKEDAINFEGGRNPFYPPPELMSAVDYSKKNLIGDGNPHVGHPPKSQNLLSLDVRNTMVEDGIFSSLSNLEKLPRKAEIQLDSMDFQDDNNVFISVENKRQDFPAAVTPNLDSQNPQTETPPCFNTNPYELDQEILAETNAPLVAWDTSSLLFPAGQDEIVTRDPEGSQSCAPLQHFDPQYQASRATEGAFGLDPSAEGPTNKHLPMQEGSIPPWYLFTSHASDNSHQNLFDPLNDVSDQSGQDAPAKMERSREISEAEEAHENLSSADPNVFSDDLLKQEFFI